MFTTLDASTRRLYLLLLTGFILFGVIFTIAGAALPQVIRTFGWSYTVTGLVLAASSAGYMLSCFVNGFLSQRVAPKLIMLAGLVIGAACMAFFMRFPSPWLNLALNFGIGICQGCLEVVTNVEVIHMERRGQSRLMNLIHACFCVGAVVGPAAVGYILKENIPLTAIFVASAGLFGCLAVLTILVRFPRVRAEQEAERGLGRRMLGNPLILLMTAALFTYVGTEIGVSSWSSEYSVRVLNVAASTAAFAVSLYWLGMLAGRLTISLAYKGSRQELLMLGLSVFGSLSLAAMLLARSTPAVAVAVFAAGLGSSGFYPLGMSLLGRDFRSTVAVGTAATGGAGGAIAFPFLMAVVSQSVGIRSGFWFYFGMALLLVALSAALVGMVRRRGVSRSA
ncbi:MAG TPA: MFS transporter [Spirochaetia bacterium]|nr:MFS transporter [Spirochaetia bacterium]